MDSSQACPVARHERLILVTDGSIFSEGAIQEALSFATKCSGKLYVISVLETNPGYETVSSSVFKKEEAEILAHLASIKSKAVDQGLRCETIFYKGGEPHRIIVEEAAERHIDMIVIGRRGRKGLAKLLMGEEAAKVIGNAPCKVLVVPKSARIGYRNILIATDGSKHAEAAANEAVNIAKRCESNLTAVSACHSESELEEAKSHVDKIAKLARQENIPVEILTPVGRPYDVVVEIAGGRGVDLIFM